MGRPVVLPADASDAQPGDLVAAQPGEQPGQRDRTDQLHRIVGVGGVAGQIGGVQVQPRPQQLGPHLVGDHAGIGADQGGDTAGHCQRPVRVEPAADPVPFLAVAEEHSGGGEDALLGARGDRGAGAGDEAFPALHVVADGHPVHRGDPLGTGGPGPLAGLGDLGVLGGKPAPGLGHLGANGRADPRGQCRGGMPPLDPVRPRRIGAFDLGGVVVSGAHRRIAMAQRGDHPLQRIQHRSLVPVGGRMRPQRDERRGVQVVEPGTAVE